MKKLWAFVSEDGIVAMNMPGVGWMPMVCLKKSNAEEWQAHAQKIAMMSGKVITLMEFGFTERVAEFKPEAN